MSRKQKVGFETPVAAAEGPALPGPGTALKAERVQEELKAMPGWELFPHGKALHRAREFAVPMVAAKFASYAAELAATAHQSVQLQWSGTRVSVILHGRGGITETLLGFARQLG